MPQLWMTYEELGDLFYGNAVTARDHVIANQWERRRCSDGVTRAVIPPNAMMEFMLAVIARPHGHADGGASAAHHDEYGLGQRKCQQERRPLRAQVVGNDHAELAPVVAAHDPPFSDARALHHHGAPFLDDLLVA
jgi:hypothetical protein